MVSTVAFTQATSNRSAQVDVVSDSNALLGLTGFKSTKVYQSPHKVTVTNQTASQLTASNNQVSSANGKLDFQTESKGPTNPLSLGRLDTGESQTFEIVTASGYTGEVTDDVTISYGKPDAVQISVARPITINFKASGRLVYAINGNVRVYDAVQDKELAPANKTEADVVSANAFNFTAGSNADISFASQGKTGVYSTEVNATKQNKIRSNSPKTHGILKQKTRLAMAKANDPPIDVTDNPNKKDSKDVEPGEYVLLYANQNKSKIFAMDADGNIEQVMYSGNGAAGVSGVADLDNDGKDEMVFLDSSQQLRYLDHDGSKHKIQNGGVGSNNSAGFGPPAEFEQFSNIQIPFVDGSQYPSLVDYNGNKTTLKSSDVAKKAALAPVDVDNDGKLEVVFIGSGDPYNGSITYIDEVGTTNKVKELTIGTGVNGKSNVTRKPDETVGLNSGTGAG